MMAGAIADDDEIPQGEYLWREGKREPRVDPWEHIKSNLETTKRLRQIIHVVDSSGT